MSLIFSLQKSATHLSLLFMGAAGSFLVTNFLPQKALLVEQSVPYTGSQLLVADAVSLSTDSSTSSGIPEKLGGARLLLGLALGAGAVGVALNTKRGREPFNLDFTAHRVGSNPNLSSKESSLRIEQASGKLQKKLLRLLHDDRDTANRLLAQVKGKNPYKSVDWCVEKVIYDLERDRGGY